MPNAACWHVGAVSSIIDGADVRTLCQSGEHGRRPRHPPPLPPTAPRRHLDPSGTRNPPRGTLKTASGILDETRASARFLFASRLKWLPVSCSKEPPPPALPPIYFLLDFTARFASSGDVSVWTGAVRVVSGQRVLLNTDFLRAQDGGGRPDRLVYAVTAAPRHGLLHAAARPGVPLVTFTQMDVAAQRVCYTHDNGQLHRSDAFRSVGGSDDA